MSYLVDTNVLSEVIKKDPERSVVEWFRIHEREIYVSAISIGEICRGIERLPDGKKKEVLRFWLKSLCDSMKGRVLSFNISTAHVWGQLKASWEKRGINISSLDGQIAATAHRHQLIIVTRNTNDFFKTGINLFNPFSSDKNR